MRPKKIYLNEKMYYDDEEVFSKYGGVYEHVTVERINDTDIEYTDLTQVWHTDKDIPEDGDACLLLILRENDYCEEDEMCFRDYNSLTNPRVAFPIWEQVKMWAYLSDLMPKGGGHDTK